ncbi:MAG TPA: glutamine synthetase, partial [Candidatus Atribacteria bacterium]|nr:glutamine synthetase [Candidatus Atribacteria bacterium]
MKFNIESKEDVIGIVKKEKVLFIRLQFVDILGMPKNIVIPSDRIEDALDDGIAFDG